MIMNFKYIWLTSPNAMQTKVSSAVVYGIYAVCAPPCRFRPLPRPASYIFGLVCSVKKTFFVHPCL